MGDDDVDRLEPLSAKAITALREARSLSRRADKLVALGSACDQVSVGSVSEEPAAVRLREAITIAVPRLYRVMRGKAAPGDQLRRTAFVPLIRPASSPSRWRRSS